MQCLCDMVGIFPYAKLSLPDSPSTAIQAEMQMGLDGPYYYFTVILTLTVLYDSKT